jgi:hypothetical protein
MRFAWFIACLIVAITCAQNAVGAEQYFFAPGREWLWWFPAIGWVLTGIAALCKS